ncbi:MAG TPA: carboxypeptidase-like regulatory domain-containing protein [Terriglobia bacterium]|nr:carboxypeptidase-like regulatory domain-containing protein [Terriglobia bacterium]
MKFLAIAASILVIQVNSAPPSPQTAKATIEGTVVRSGTGGPIAGAIVSLSDRGRPADGTFRIDSLFAGEYVLRANLPEGFY